LLPWLLCLLGARLGPGLHSLGWFWDEQLALAMGLLLLTASGACALRDRLRLGPCGLDPGALLAALALLLWQLGFHAPGAQERWCMAVVRSPTGGAPLEAAEHHAAVGLMLLDDMLHAVLRFVACTPLEAWPFALASQRNHHLWVQDEEWWEACYRSAGWMRLPANPKLPGGRRARTEGRPRHLLREAALWAAVMAETLRMMVVLRPKCAAPCWVAAPCVASTLLVVSCSPWLAKQGDLVLVEMAQLTRVVSRFAIYFQAVWIVALGLLLRPEELALCALPEGNAALRALELGALAVLYIVVAGHLWEATARCRAASPLYAVPAEDVMPDPAFRSRPLYCGSLGLVEGSYAPTRMCDWDELPGGQGQLRWRERYTLRRCAELLAARESHLLSHLDALHSRLAEAELEVHSPGRCARPAPPSRLGKLLGLLAVAACAAAAQGWCSSCCARAMDSGGSLFEAVLWASLLVRVSHDWYSLMLRSAAAWEAAGHTAYAEVVALRQQASALHSSLAEAQWLLWRLEARLEGLGVAVQRPRGRTAGCVRH